MKLNIPRSLSLIVLIFLLFILPSSQVFADGFIVIPHPPPHPPPYPRPPIIRPSAPFPLDVLYHHVQVTIKGQTATTNIDQVFYNPTSRQLEGYYMFPIPVGAVLQEFTMSINGRQVSAELLDAKKARSLYEEIVRKLKDPALLEYSYQGLFKVRIFPIEPHSKKRVTLSYKEMLTLDYGTYTYLYPLNTEKFSAKQLKEVSVNVEIIAPDELKNIYCPTHEVDVVRKGARQARVSYEEQNVKPDRDFKLYFNTSSSPVGLSLLTYQTGREDGYFCLSATPAYDQGETDVNEKDITFVLDVSGSMAGDKLKQAKKAVIYCIENLNVGDRFEVIRFSTEAYALFRELVSASEANRDQAREFVNTLRPVGGTAIEDALQLALSSPVQRERPHMIIFITDGKPTIGETNEDRLLAKIEKANISRTRIFTFGIGHEINTHLLDKITELSKATRTYIAPTEDIEIKISNFYDKVQSPVLTDIALNFGRQINVYQTYPQQLPDLFRGSNITIFGRYKGQGETKIVLSGMARGKGKEFLLAANFEQKDTQHDFIPPLWAARRIGHLLDLIRLHGQNKELVDEITVLARTFGIVTPYTSYLIMEDEAVRTVSRDIREEFQTLGRIGNVARESKKRYKAEFDAMKLKSGDQSVQVSKEFQALNEASNVPQTAQGGVRLDYKDGEGKMQNLTQQVKNVMGRAMYQSGKFWVDSQLQSTKPRSTVRIKFAAPEFFELLRNKPETAQFLALGQNVRFYLNDTYYEIYE
ncbi:VIT domain-containing protein [candidate division CSSED10-310 bacterium]|uniref:VIT domain-containing protein n=1 Tax=candidate division CSSED10-310 bacterium TaxID=2855610 RepID=A0ABV6Z211_UNCC1